MKIFSFKKLDAFTSGSSSGNPAGYIELANSNEITEVEMQRIGYELKGYVSEVGFVWPSTEEGIDFNFRYFSCEKEVALCAHATVAIGYELANENKNIQSKPFISIRTNKGVLRIENRFIQENLVYLQAPSPVFIECNAERKSLAQALNIDAKDIDTDNPIEIVNAGLNTLLVPLNNKEACINCSPDYMTLRNYSINNNADVINIYTSDTVFDKNNYRTRVFAPTYGYLEDPATGSGNAALGYYLIKHKIWDAEKLFIEQGTSRDNPNIVVLKKINDNEILIGGRAVTRIKGKYLLV